MPKTIIPFGPQHPVLPEPLQLKLVMQDEKIVEAVPSIGYVHRGLEKLTEKKDFISNIYVVERVCGICSNMHALAYCMCIEELMGLEIPDRAKFLRVIWAELHRMHSLLMWMGFAADSLGFESLFMQCWRNREKVMDIMEDTSGHRIFLSTNTVGGTHKDLNREQIANIRVTMDLLWEDMRQIEKVFYNDLTVQHRLRGVGVLTREKAYELGACGPMAKASGLAYDHRTQGYAAYGELEFEPVVEQDGDSYARAIVRLREFFQSIDLIKEALDKLPAGEIAVPFKGFPKGEAITRVEQPRGEVLYYVRANGTKTLDRLRIRTPTFANLPSLLHVLPGSSLADVPVLILTIDPCISCMER